MTIDQAIGKMLNDSIDVTDIVGPRIDFGKTPETVPTYPKINYFMVSRPQILSGNLNMETWQISCRAKTPQAGLALAEIVENLFKNFQGTIDTFDIQAIVFLNTIAIEEPEDVYHFPVDIQVTY